MSLKFCAHRSESNLCDSPRQHSPITRQRCIIAEHQRQLHREMLEMHDTLTRGLRTRSQLPVWDSSSMVSWKSSVGSISRWNSKKSHPRIWDTVRGTFYYQIILNIQHCHNTYIYIYIYIYICTIYNKYIK